MRCAEWRPVGAGAEVCREVYLVGDKRGGARLLVLEQRDRTREAAVDLHYAQLAPRVKRERVVLTDHWGVTSTTVYPAHTVTTLH